MLFKKGLRVMDSGLRGKTGQNFKRSEEKKAALPDFLISRLPVLCLLITCLILLVAPVHSEILDRIVAIVNDDVILLSEYKEALQAAEKSGKQLTDDMVLNEMIDRMLILEQAKRLRLDVIEDATGAVDKDRTINEYIERRIKAFVHVPIDKIESYYLSNKEQFGNKTFSEAKDEIEDRLTEGELKTKIAEHMAELRRKAYIRIQKEPTVLHSDK